MAWWAIGIGTAASVGGSLWGKEKGGTVESNFGPITGIGTAEELEQKIREGMKTGATPYDKSFGIDQNAVEKATESTILGKLNNLPQLQGNIQETGSNIYKTQKAMQDQSFEDERKKTAERYNRLGLVSSTPGLNALGEVDNRQRLSEEALSATIAQREVELEMQATQMANDIANQILGQAQTFGAGQRADARTTQAYEYGDFGRMAPENNPWLDRAQQILGTFSSGNTYVPNGMNNFGKVMSGVGSMANMVGASRLNKAAPDSNRS